jgi:predicted phage-related endonuclease
MPRRIGGSDLPKLLGLSPYGGPLEVYERIVNGVEAEWNPRMERGAAVEPELRAFAQRMLGLELEDFESDIAIHPGVEFAHAQCDDRGRLRGMPVVADYKSQSTFAKGWGPDGSDIVPEHYRAQMAWELACSDRDLGLFIVGFGEDLPPPRLFHIANVLTYHIERDGVFESYALDVARTFWETHILPRVPPAATPTKERKHAVRIVGNNP